MARICEERVVVGGSYDQDGYLQVYDRNSDGDVVHELLTLEGSAITNVQIAGKHRIVALLAIRFENTGLPTFSDIGYSDTSVTLTVLGSLY